MWGEMFLVSLGIKGIEAMGHIGQPKIGTEEYLIKEYPNSYAGGGGAYRRALEKITSIMYADLPLTWEEVEAYNSNIRNKRNGIIYGGEKWDTNINGNYKPIPVYGMTLSEFHKKLADENNKNLNGMSEEEYVNMLLSTKRMVYRMGDYEVYYSECGYPYVYVICDPINKKLMKNGWQREFTKEAALQYFQRLDTVYINGAKEFREKIELEKKIKEQKRESENRLRRLENLVYRYAVYEIYLDRQKNEKNNCVVYNKDKGDWIRENNGGVAYFMKYDALKYVNLDYGKCLNQKKIAIKNEINTQNIKSEEYNIGKREKVLTEDDNWKN